MIKLHLGCGKCYLEGFTHIDIQGYDHVDHQSDIRSLSMFDSNTVSIIYASHVLEYFDEIEALEVLREWHRVLCPGGKIQISMPDFSALVEVYEISRSIAMIIGPLYGRIQFGDAFIYHKSAWDFSSLSVILRSIGFRGIERVCAPWHPELSDCSDAVTSYESKSTPISMNVQAVKL